MIGWSDIISNSAMIYIDDVRLHEQLVANPAMFFRKMALYVSNALPLMSRPVELLNHLQNEMVEPQYSDVAWVSDESSLESATTIETGLTDYDLVNVAILDSAGNITPYTDFVYDSETGNVTFPQQTEVGIEYEIDFYKDGTFADLTATQMRLFGLAIAIVWDERFSRNWLNMQMKIKDSSFETVNESNYIEKVTERMEVNRRRFNDELRKYEQDIAYNKVVPNFIKKRELI